MLDFFGVVSSMTQDPRPGSVHESHQPKGAFLEGKSLKIPHRFALFFFTPSKWVPFNDPCTLQHVGKPHQVNKQLDPWDVWLCLPLGKDPRISAHRPHPMNLWRSFWHSQVLSIYKPCLKTHPKLLGFLPDISSNLPNFSTLPAVVQRCGHSLYGDSPGGYKPSAPGAVSQAGEWECSPRFGDAEKGPGIFCLSIPIGFLLVENQCFLSWVSWVLNWSVSLFCALFSPMILRSLTKNLAWFWWWALVILHDQFARWLLWPSGRSLLLCLVAPTSFPSMFWKLTSGKMRCNLMVGNDCPFPR